MTSDFYRLTRGRITDKNVESRVRTPAHRMETGGLRMIKRSKKTLKTSCSAVFGRGDTILSNNNKAFGGLQHSQVEFDNSQAKIVGCNLLHQQSQNVGCAHLRTAKKRIDKQKKAAFTLAEVLITLGIVGVVAALTLPALLTNVQAKIRAEQIRSAKYKFSLATEKMARLNLIGPYDSTDAFVDELQKYLNVVT